MDKDTERINMPTSIEDLENIIRQYYLRYILTEETTDLKSWFVVTLHLTYKRKTIVILDLIANQTPRTYTASTLKAAVELAFNHHSRMIIGGTPR